ncbi:hypothetical protein [Bradyrhizobium zhanjiangense]|uniref:hypothetical protein n=1 Tax=Bradyrhizobium zhanjiangense TaxID=1325107 RepID=UPI0010089B28|nr:hypothetical protein [Bradyrhizobium zhanjiangense]
MNQPVRRKHGRGDATHTNQFRRDMNILWKSFDLSSNDAAPVIKHRSRTSMTGLRRAESTIGTNAGAILQPEAERAPSFERSDA